MIKFRGRSAGVDRPVVDVYVNLEMVDFIMGRKDGKTDVYMSGGESFIIEENIYCVNAKIEDSQKVYCAECMEEL